MKEIAEEISIKGGRPYTIPYGGSNGIGAAAYALAMVETAEQLDERGIRPSRIIVASSSGGTQAGLVLGGRMAGLTTDIIGISIDKGERDPEPYEEELARIAGEAADLLGIRDRPGPRDFAVEYGYLGGGYGVVGELERGAILLLARLEGILLDPVYTGRAMGALITMVHNGDPGPDETILFWHSGGTPALFAYEPDLGVSPPAAR
jgi:D-cysteine desulfhydrase